MTDTRTATGASPTGEPYQSNHLVFRECGPGWNRLIEPIVARATALKVTISQVKEKYGGLVVYFNYTDGNGLPHDEEHLAILEDMVDEAATESFRVCEICGQPGVRRVSGIWLKTLCDEHANELGYRKKA
jgi:hypothetical protein